MKTNINNFYKKILKRDFEQEKMMQFFDELKINTSAKILDVGCGYGRNLRKLQEKRYDVLGVDKNTMIIKKNISNGLNCCTPDELKNIDNKFDVLLMSHVIEHLESQSLFEFMNHYLSFLKDGGYLVIATPLVTKNFFIDFDHVKSYYPSSILQVFSHTQLQTQFETKNVLKLRKLWFRKGKFNILLKKDLFIKTKFTPIYKAINSLFALLHVLSFGLFGKKNGWLGIYQKINGNK